MQDDGRQPCELGVSEYDVAGFDFFHRAMRKMMEAQDPIYAQMPKEKREFLGSDADNADAGDAPRSADPTVARTFDMQYEIRFDIDEAISGKQDRLLAVIDGAAKEALKQLMPQIYAHISEICEATGNTVSGQLTHDMILDAFERVQTTINEDGSHNISIVMSPEAYRKYLALGPMTSEQEERYKSIIIAKRKDQNVRKRSRTLPGIRN